MFSWNLVLPFRAKIDLTMLRTFLSCPMQEKEKITHCFSKEYFACMLGDVSYVPSPKHTSNV